MKKLLVPASYIYHAGIKIDRLVTRQHTLGKPVISVGNITWGGTGKTPAVIALARFFAEHDRKAVVLTRGYRRKQRAMLVVSNGSGMMAEPEQAGDEPFLIARECPEAVVIAGADRYAAGTEAQKRFNPDVFILDDGFQHWRLARDLDVVCINATDPFGNGCLIPAGTLRECPEALHRAGIILLTNADQVDTENVARIEEEIRRYTHVPICKTCYALEGIRRIYDGSVLPADELKGREVTVVSALGNAAGFLRSVEATGMEIVGQKTFRDHHWYSAEDVKKMRSTEKTLFVTTAKDAVKLKSLLQVLARDASENEFIGRWYEINSGMSFMSGENAWQEKIKLFL
jgi:tetraacyldisaccharide 4'-kinase